MPNRIVEFEPYRKYFRPVISPIKSNFCLFLNRVDQEITIYSERLPIFRVVDEDEEELIRPAGISLDVYRLFKSVIYEYQILKNKACRKIDYYSEFTNSEQRLFDQELAKLEYFGACIIEFKYYEGFWDLEGHPIIRLGMPCSIWSKVRLKSFTYDPNTYKIEIETKDPLTIISRVRQSILQ